MIKTLRRRIEKIIFDTDTRAGKIYDIALIVIICLSVVFAMLDSIAALNAAYGSFFYRAEWLFTILFTFDYIVRLACVSKPIRYARSFFGVVDLLGVLPTYFSLIFPGGRYLVVIRFLRILRLFRILKMVAYIKEAQTLIGSLRRSRRKIAVFLFAVMILVVVLGSLMYVVEGNKNGFTSIPQSIYWAIVTLTTVGYGDISPQTPLGKAIAAAVMILGYSIIIIPTGIVSMDMAQSVSPAKPCWRCNRKNDNDAAFCKYCGSAVGENPTQ